MASNYSSSLGYDENKPYVVIKKWRKYYQCGNGSIWRVYGGNGIRGNFDSFTHDGNYVLIGRQGALCGNINYASGKFWASEHAIVVTPDREVDTYWLGETLRVMNLGQLSTAAAQPGISVEVVNQQKIPFPPLEEQKCISKFIELKTVKIDNLINKKKELLEKLKDRRLTMITCAVTEGINPQVPMKNSGDDFIGDIPEHWETRRLKFLTQGSLKYGANEAAESTDRDSPRYIRITDVKSDGTLHDHTFRSLDEETALPYLLKEGDILLARSGATVGKSFIYKRHWGKSAYAGYLIKFRTDVKLINSDFAYYFFNSSPYWRNINSTLIQATIQNFSAEKYGNLRVTLPPLEEQREIVEYLRLKLESTDIIMAKVQAAIDKLCEYRKALIFSAVSGKIDVRNLENPEG